MKKAQKSITVPRGQNIGQAIMNSFVIFSLINVLSIDNIHRVPRQKENIVQFTYTYK